MAPPDAPPLHADLEPLAFLLGTWVGEGRGEYPTIEPFGYRETATFGQVGKPFLTWAQRTAAADDGRPLHAETGYWRPAGPAGVELVCAHPSGHVELATGTVEATPGGGRLRVESSTLAGTPTAKQVDALVREVEVDGDVLTYRVAMAAVGVPLTHHLAATLRREP